MNDTPEDRGPRLRSRRKPPPLIEVTVAERLEITPRLLRLSLEGPGLEPMLAEPAASVRLLVPSPGTDVLVLPEWNGNEFLLPGGTRPALRTFTPLRSHESGRLDIEIVRHPGGVVSSWAETVVPGSPAAISGPGRGFEPPENATTYHLLGDETALPAIGQLLEFLPTDKRIEVYAEVFGDDAIRPLPEHPGATIIWLVAGEGDQPCARLVAAATDLTELSETDHVWAAGEAASVQAIRKQLFNERGLARQHATVRGYWKPDRTPTS
jgi:NADPH-dependent ferric siderophore reductase